MEENKKRACLLCRVSTNKVEQKSSILNQIDQLTSIILSFDDIIFDPSKDIFEDIFTGTKIQRKNKNNNGFNRLMELLNIEIIDKVDNDTIELTVKTNRAKKPYYDVIFCKSTSRFSRASYKGESIIYLLKDLGVDIYYLDLGKYLSAMSDEEIKLYSLIDNKYSRTVSFNYRNTNVLKTANREIMTTNKKFAYDRVRINGHVYFKKKEEEYQVFCMMKELFNKGYGCEKISYILQDKGIKSITGKDFHKSSVHNILTDFHYCGLEKYYIYPKEYTNRFGIDRKYLSELPYELVKCDYIEPLETEEEYYSRIEEFKKRTIDGNGKFGQKPPLSEVSKMCVCSICGKHYYSKGINAQYKKGEKSYMCSSKRFSKKYRQIQCTNKAFYEKYFYEWAEKKANAFADEIRNSITYNFNNLALLQCHLLLSTEKNKSDEVKELVKERDRLKERLDELISNSLSSESGLKVINAFIAKIDKELIAIDKKIKVYDDYKKQVQLCIDRISLSMSKLTEIKSNLKPSYTVQEMFEFSPTIYVYPKNEHKVNSVSFVLKTKLEAEIEEILTDIFNSDIVNFLPPKTFKIKTNSENGFMKVFIKQLSEEELLRATEIRQTL